MSCRKVELSLILLNRNLNWSQLADWLFSIAWDVLAGERQHDLRSPRLLHWERECVKHEAEGRTRLKGGRSNGTRDKGKSWHLSFYYTLVSTKSQLSFQRWTMSADSHMQQLL